MDEIDRAYKIFYKDIEPKWSIEDAIERYITLFAQYYTENEIEELLNLTKTPIYQKSLRISKEMGPKWDNWIKEQHKSVLDDAMPKFMEKYNSIVEKINEKACE